MAVNLKQYEKVYETVFEKEVAEIGSQAVLVRHRKTGARVLVLSNEDDNKVFYIGFRTPPKDSTGLPHIMEHSVLCGSEKFPLKDPFVELAKGSLNTYLNAMTFPDKTVYPVASRNDKDFANLMDVYLDAVLHPNIYKYPEILKQEGWSYKIESPEEPITYNGVVYNEMKGVFSSPEDVLGREIFNSLFPDTPYGKESGGDPEFIPDLTYEDFIEFHKTYYHPSNSFIYLYGDMDVEERLAWLDREYLSAYDERPIDSEIEKQKEFGNRPVIQKFYPVTDEEEEEDNTYLSYNIVCGDIMDVKEMIALQMIMYVLVENQGASIRQRLLDEGIAKDVLSVFCDEILQPYMSIAAKNSNYDRLEDFIRLINEETEKAAKEGLEKRSLTACLNSMKFRHREADFGTCPKGLAYGLSALSAWLYDDEKPLCHLELNETFDELEKEIETDYFEKLVRKYFIGSRHSTIVILRPQRGLAQQMEQACAQKLASFKESLSPEEIDRLIEETRALSAYQEAESTKEELETIPLLERSDIKREAEPFNNIEDEVGKIPFIRHEYNTNEIAYVSIIFDANMINKEQLPYIGLLKSVVGFVDTGNYTYQELNDEINTYTGGLSFEAGAGDRRHNPKGALITAGLSTRMLYENIDKTFDLVREILLAADYSDTKRLKEIISEQRSQMQMDIVSSGHAAATLRAASYHCTVSALKEQIGGIEFYKFIEGLEADFDEKKDEIVGNIQSVLAQILKPRGMIVGCTADERGAQTVKKSLERFVEALEEYAGEDAEAGSGQHFRDRSYDFEKEGFSLKALNEAFKTSGSVNYVARSGRYIDDESEYPGYMQIYHTIMRFDYLWFNIRVQGGAYGCMCNSAISGRTYCATFRDPHIKRSNEVFEKIPDFLEEFDCDEREMTKYVIGTMSVLDAPKTVYAKGQRDMMAYLQGLDYQEVMKIRSEVIDCTPEDVRSIAPLIRKALNGGYICCIGSSTKIEEDNELFDSIRTLIE